MRQSFLPGVLVASIFLCGCGGTKSKSPYFVPGTPLTVSGRFLDDDGSPLTDTPIHFRNIRKFAYIDSTSAALAEGAETVFGVLMFMAFPFFPFYDSLLSSWPFSNDPSRFETKANYYFESIRTDSAGDFSFRVVSDKMLRDENGGINIVVVNEKKGSNRFGKFSFVLKAQDSALGDLRLNELGGITLTESEAEDKVTLAWTAPAQNVAKYVLRVGTQSNNALIWSEDVAADKTSVTLPRVIFHDLPARAAVEAFYTFQDDEKKSSLTSPKEFTLRSTSTPISTGALGTAPNIPFRLTSLTNRSFSDRSYFDAFGSSAVTLDLGVSRAFSRVILHNLRLHASGNATLSVSEDGSTFTDVATLSEKRFVDHEIGATATGRFVRLSFSARIADLQEITLL